MGAEVWVEATRRFRGAECRAHLSVRLGFRLAVAGARGGVVVLSHACVRAAGGRRFQKRLHCVTQCVSQRWLF